MAPSLPRLIAACAAMVTATAVVSLAVAVPDPPEVVRAAATEQAAPPPAVELTLASDLEDATVGYEKDVAAWYEGVKAEEQRIEAVRIAAERAAAQAAEPVRPVPVVAAAASVTSTYDGACSGMGDPNNLACWDRLAGCESGGNWATNTGNGYYGGIQFSLSSWRAVGGTGYPHQASRATQIELGQRLWNQGGWGHWPGCTALFGWR